MHTLQSRTFAGLTTLTVLGCLTTLTGPSAIGDDAVGSDAKARTCLGHKATIVGTRGDDVIDGKATDRRDVIVARGGNDTIYSYGGRDLICSGKGPDTVDGFNGADRIVSSSGGDTIYGNSGGDRLLAGKGRDRLYGEDGRDYLNGGPGVDRTDASSGSGNDTCKNIEKILYPPC